MFLIYFLLSSFFLYSFVEVIINSGPIFYDLQIMSFVRDNIYPFLLNFMKILDILGGEYFMYPLGIVLFIYFLKRGDKKSIWLLIVSLAVPYLLMGFIKAIAARPRPAADFMLVSARGYSFPSGHTTVATAFYLNMARYFSPKLENEKNNYIFISIAVILFLMMGFSRIYLGVHWASDVICGFILGFLSADAGMWIVKKYVR